MRTGHDQTCLPAGVGAGAGLGPGGAAPRPGALLPGQLVRTAACAAAGLGGCDDEQFVPALVGDYACQSEAVSAAHGAAGRLRARAHTAAAAQSRCSCLLCNRRFSLSRKLNEN